MNDESLLQAAAHGDEAAFRILYERHRDIIFRFSYRMLQSVELAEEITHDCFLSLIKKPSRFDATRATLRTYLCAAARNQAFKHLKKSGNETSFEDLGAEPRQPENSNPLRQIISEELAVVVRQAISELPPFQREALILFEYEELSLAEIALIVSAEIGTVKSRLFRARENLKQLLSPYMRNQTEEISQ